MKRLMLILFSTFVISGCDGDSPTAPTNVIGPTWMLVSLQEVGAPPVVVENPSQYTVRFDADGRLAVMSDCNGCGGSYVLSDSSVRVESLQCTLVACPESSLDGRFRQSLERARSLSRDDDELIIETGDVTLRFRN